jgi:hypothetical protein
MLRRTPLKRVSKKHQAELVIYRKLRAEYLKNHPTCAFVGCIRNSTDVHHVCKRGKNLNNVETWRALCRECHMYVENNKSWARLNGWLK